MSWRFDKNKAGEMNTSDLTHIHKSRRNGWLDENLVKETRKEENVSGNVPVGKGIALCLVVFLVLHMVLG